MFSESEYVFDDYSEIKLCNKIEYEEILSWIESQKKRKIETFSTDLKTIGEHFKNQNLYAYKDNKNNAIAYQCGGFIKDTIFEVKYEFRKQGIGKKFANYFFDKAKKNSVAVLFVDCQPNSSLPFWKKMGFKSYINEFSSCHRKVNNQYILYMPLHQHLSLPVEGNEVNIEISCYPDNKLYEENYVKSYDSLKMKGIRNICNTKIFLEYKFSFPALEGEKIVIEIIVENKEVYLGRAKDIEGYLENDRGHYFINHIDI